MVNENILFAEKNLCMRLHTLFFRVKDSEKNEKKSEKMAMFLKIFLKIEAEHVLKMFLTFGQF